MSADTRRVLVVEDDPQQLEILELRLANLGHTVQVALDGPRALELCAALPPERRPEVFILDIVMPRMDGWDLARRLKALPGFAESLFIALTGYSTESTQSEMALVLRKPYALDALNRLILSPVQSARAQSAGGTG